MTNYEKIKAMSVEEMAEFMFDENTNNYNYCNFCKEYKYYAPHCSSNDFEKDCKKARMEWLEREVEEDG